MIEDLELRDIYKTTSAEHLQKLERGLLELEKHPEEEDAYIEALMREAHSLKGDSRIVGCDDVEHLAHAIEDLFGSIKCHETGLSPQMSDRLYHGIDAMRLLVTEAVTGASSGIEAQTIINELKQPSSNGHSSAIITLIEDEELREIYKTSSAEHLQKLETGLLELEKHPEEEEAYIEELMREAHSLKGDSRIVGCDNVENLAHSLEDIFGSIKRHETQLTPQISDHLYHSIDAMELLVNEAVTGKSSGININNLLQELRGDIISVTPEENHAQASPTPSNQENITTQKTEEKVSKPSQVSYNNKHNNKPSVGEPYHIDTIRVQTSHLDTLMTQTGELTVTKTRIAHAASAVEEMISVWEEWKSHLDKQGYLGTENGHDERLEQIISHLRTTTQENSSRLDLITGELEEKIRTLRLLPLSTVFQLFPRMVRDLAKEEGKEVELIIEGGETSADKQILEEIKDPLMHMIRNAIDHGIETPTEREQVGKPRAAKIWLRGYQRGNNIWIEIQDDGRGLDLEKIKETALRKGLCRPEELETMGQSQIQSLILQPGFSTRNFITEVSGRGVGLDVVRANVERLKGSIQIQSTWSKGCTFRIQLGITLATANVVLIRLADVVYAIPIEFVQTNLLVKPEEIFTIEGRQTIALDNQAVSVAYLDDLLQLNQLNNRHLSDLLPCVLLSVGEERLGLFVDEVVDAQDVVIKPQSKLLKRVRNVTGATILGTGEVCMILNPVDLLQSVQKNPSPVLRNNVKTDQAQDKAVILLAEDSIATRTQEKRILQSAGYEVVTAVDGLDGWNKLNNGNFDAVISDVQMPNLDGLSLTERIRQQQQFAELPIILVTSLSSDEDKRKGAEAGANAYIVKDRFNQDILLDTLGRLV